MGPAIQLTPNLILRVEDESKAAQVLDLYIRNRVQFEEFEPTRPTDFYTIAYHTQALRREYRAYMLGTFLRYYIYSRYDDSKIIGSVNFNLYCDETRQYAEIGYKIDHMHQNRGYAYEACMAGMDILAKHYNIHHIDARIHPDNSPSLSLARKMNFRYMAMEAHSANIKGQDVDLIRYTHYHNT